MYLLRGLIAWAVMMAGESGFAVLRTLFLAPVVGDFRARQIGFFAGAALILGVACLLIRWIGATTRGRLLAVGLLWAALTFAFEVAVGRLAIGLSAEELRGRMMEDYDPSGGGLMGFGLVVLVVSPSLAWKFRQTAGAGR